MYDGPDGLNFLRFLAQAADLLFRALDALNVKLSADTTEAEAAEMCVRLSRLACFLPLNAPSSSQARQAQRAYHRARR